MSIETRANGRLEIRISPTPGSTAPSEQVQLAALEAVRKAIENSQALTVERTEDGIMVVLANNPRPAAVVER